MSVSAIPAGYHSITPYLVVGNASQAIDFYQQAFGAMELFRLADPSGGIGHAEVKIGNSPFMLADEHPDMGFVGPQSLGGTPVSLLLYVENVDEVFERAIQLGATPIRPLQDQFYGDRTGTIQDPFGHLWTVATHIEDVSPAEMQQRFEQMTGDEHTSGS